MLSGGVVAPVLLLWGLSGSGAAETSLLLNFEAVITALIAAALFREAVGGRVWFAALVMLAGGFVLAYDPGAPLALSAHSLAVVAACFGWAVDNNLTRKVAAADPVVITTIKGLAAGSFNLALGLALGGMLPAMGAVAGALALGFVAYGLSLVLYTRALRHLGAARTAAHFSTAPFIGAAIAILVLGEPFTASFGRRPLADGRRNLARADRTTLARARPRALGPQPSPLPRRAPPTLASRRRRSRAPRPRARA